MVEAFKTEPPWFTTNIISWLIVMKLCIRWIELCMVIQIPGYFGSSQSSNPDDNVYSHGSYEREMKGM